MTKVNLNLINIREKVKSVNIKLDNYKENYLSLNRNLKNVDSSWKDINTEVFLKTISNDKKNCLEHISSIKKYLNKLEEFCDDLETELKKIFNLQKINKIQIDCEYINSSIENINNCSRDLNDIVYIMSKTDIVIPYDFKYKYAIEAIKSDIDKNKEIVLKLKNKLIRIKDIISSLIEQSKFKINKLDFKTIDDKCLNYFWKIYGIQKRNSVETNIDSVKSKSNKININNTNNNNNINPDVNKLNNNISQVFFKKNDEEKIKIDITKNNESQVNVSVNRIINPNINQLNTTQGKININTLNRIENNEKDLNRSISEVNFNTKKQEYVDLEKLYQNNKTVENIKVENSEFEKINSLKSNNNNNNNIENLSVNSSTSFKEDELISSENTIKF